MKKIISLILFLIGPVFLYSQTKVGIAQTDDKCRQIKNNLHTFVKREAHDYSQSTDGGTIRSYYKDGFLQIITAEYFGESGKQKTSYFFYKDRLIYVVEDDYEYNRPYYWDKKMARVNGDNASFNAGKTKQNINKYYFNDTELIRWINDSGHAVNDSEMKFSEKGKNVLHELERIRLLVNDSMK